MAFNLQNFVKQQLTNALKRGAQSSLNNNNGKQNSNQINPARANPLSGYIADLMKVLNEGNSKYQSPRKQYLSLLYNVIKYIMRNPSSTKELESLYQTFKNFISKRKILVPSQKCDFVGDTFIIKDEKKDLKIKVRDVINWLNENFYIENIGASLKLKTYFVTVKKLELIKSKLYYNEYEILVAENTLKCFIFFISRIHDSHHAYVPINKVLQKLPNVTEFSYITGEEKYSFKTLQTLNSIKLWHKLDFVQLSLAIVDENFDPLLFCQFIEQNAGASTIANIWLKNNSQNVKDSLEAELNRMMQTWKGQKLTFIV